MMEKTELHLLSEIDQQKLYEKLDEVQDMKLSGDALKAKAKETLELYIDKDKSNTALQKR